MVNYKILTMVFAVLTVVFIASTGIVAVSSGTKTSTVTQTTTLTTGGITTITQQSTGQTTSTTQVASAGGSSYSVILGYTPTLHFFLTNATGWTLYLFTNDTRNSGASSCYGGCAAFWPAFHGASLSFPPGVNASAFSSISRKDGTTQVTYDGWPLYFFAGDKKAGDTNGQGKFGTWFVVNVPQIIIPQIITTTATTSG